MARAEQSYGRVAQAVVGDIRQSAKAAADEVLPKGGPGAEVTTKERTIQHFRAAWPYPDLRQALFRRMVPSVQGPDGKVYPARNGMEHWENLVREAFPLGYPPPMPMAGPMPPDGAGGFTPNEVPY